MDNRKYHTDGTLPASRNSIWVFGSNLPGIHGAGAAAVARTKFKAEHGVGEGPTGEAYAIPTKDHQIETRKLEDIKKSVKKFINYSKGHPEKDFFVTRVGCGLAGYKDEDIAPIFEECSENCDLPEDWRKFIE